MGGPNVRDWLRADLETWGSLLKNGPPEDSVLIQQNLAHWRVDADLASIRDDSELSNLPETERTALRTLWADVADLLARAGGQK